MDKIELREKLLKGHTMDSLFHFSQGQDCLIYKAEEFVLNGDIMYIPDIDLNEIPMDRPLLPDEVDEVVSLCYDAFDFVNETLGDMWEAQKLFAYCDWQHPSSAYPEICDEGDW